MVMVMVKFDVYALRGLRRDRGERVEERAGSAVPCSVAQLVLLEAALRLLLAQRPTVACSFWFSDCNDP